MLHKSVKSKISDRQKQLATKLSRYDARFSKRQRTLILMFFCFTYGIGSLYVAVSAITGGPPSSGFSKSVTPMDLTIPFHIGHYFDTPAAVIDSSTFNRVEHFRLWLDSLKINDAARYTGIINSRPQLLDSILEFEKIYLTHLKK